MDCKDALKDLRKKCLLSQEDFAKVIGVSFSTVNRWENGRAIPTYKTLRKINAYCRENNICLDLAEFLKEDKI